MAAGEAHPGGLVRFRVFREGTRRASSEKGALSRVADKNQDAQLEWQTAKESDNPEKKTRQLGAWAKPFEGGPFDAHRHSSRKFLNRLSGRVGGSTTFNNGNGHGRIEVAPKIETERQNYLAMNDEKSIMLTGKFHCPPPNFRGNLWEDNNKSIYSGKWTNESFFGEVTHADGSTLVGKVVKGKAEGFCVRTDANGTKLACTFERGHPVGHGVETRADGSQLRCWWANGRANGQGEERWPNGSVLRANYRNGRVHGEGELHLPDGSTMKAMWKKDQLHGRCETTMPNGDVIISQWTNGMASDDVVVNKADGARVMLTGAAFNNPSAIQLGQSRPPKLGKDGLSALLSQRSLLGPSPIHSIRITCPARPYKSTGMRISPNGFVREVVSQSLADLAGIEAGDRVESIDGRKIEPGVSALDLWTIEDPKRAEREVVLWRGKGPGLTAEKPGDKPVEWEMIELEVPDHEMECAVNLTSEAVSGFRMTPGGAVVDVHRGSAAHAARMNAGDLITRIDTYDVGDEGVDAWDQWDKGDSSANRKLLVARPKRDPIRLVYMPPPELAAKGEAQVVRDQMEAVLDDEDDADVEESFPHVADEQDGGTTSTAQMQEKVEPELEGEEKGLDFINGLSKWWDSTKNLFSKKENTEAEGDQSVPGSAGESWPELKKETEEVDAAQNEGSAAIEDEEDKAQPDGSSALESASAAEVALAVESEAENNSDLAAAPDQDNNGIDEAEFGKGGDQADAPDAPDTDNAVPVGGSPGADAPDAPDTDNAVPVGGSPGADNAAKQKPSKKSTRKTTSLRSLLKHSRKSGTEGQEA